MFIFFVIGSNIGFKVRITIFFITSNNILATFAITFNAATIMSSNADKPFFNVCSALSMCVFLIAQFLFVNARFTLTPHFIVTFPVLWSKSWNQVGGKRKKGDEDPVVMKQRGTINATTVFGAL